MMKRGKRIDLTRLLETVETDLINIALEITGDNKTRAAELLGLQRTTLVAKIRRSHQ